MEELITIQITTPEAIMFRDYQKDHELFNLLKSRGVFDQKNASIILNFDSNGLLQNIQRQDFIYSKRHLSTEL